MIKARAFGKGTRLYLTFTKAPYGHCAWPRVGTYSSSFLSIRFPRPSGDVQEKRYREVTQ